MNMHRSDLIRSGSMRSVAMQMYDEV